MCVFQDVQWNDIDYMDRSLDFTFDPTAFSTLPDMVKDLHSHGQRYVMMLVRYPSPPLGVLTLSSPL